MQEPNADLTNQTNDEGVDAVKREQHNDLIAGFMALATPSSQV